MLVLKTKYQKLSRVVFAPDRRGLAAAGQHGAYYWRSVFDDPKAARFGARACDGLGFTPDGAHLVAALAPADLLAIRLADESQHTAEMSLANMALAVCPATGLAVVQRWSGGEMSGWHVGPDGTPARVWAVRAEPASIGAAVAFAPDGSWFVRATRDSASRLDLYRLARHDPATGKEVGASPGDSWVSAGPAVSPDGKWIAYANGNRLRVQSVSRPRRREESFNENTHQYTDLAFHPTGRLLAVTNNDATVKLYDTATWEVARTFTWEIGRMRSVAFSPDGTLAAAGSDTGKVVVWDVDL